MSDHPPPGPGRPDPDEVWMPLAAETPQVSKRVRRTLVRAARSTTTRNVLVEEELVRDAVTVERVAVNRVVEAMPPIRQEGDTTVVPVVAEELVLVRRLVLKEEVRLRRVRSTEPFTEVVTLREQQVGITRSDAGDAPGPPQAVPAALQPTKAEPTTGPADGPDSEQEERAMTDETIVALYDTTAHAEAAADALRSAGVPDDAIALHAGDGTASDGGTAGGTTRDTGFWSSLFGGESTHDATVYDRSLEAGSTVVSVRVPEEHAERVMSILEAHEPIDVDERGAGYGLSQTDATAATVVTPDTGTGADMGTGPDMGTGMGTEMGTGTGSMPATGRDASDAAAAPQPPAKARGDESTMQLSEERLAVGKRAVNRGGTRIRRYVVETPVEQDVTLHDEKVVLDRRPVSDDRPMAAEDFSEKTIEMTETAEEAIISKTARVYEEVGLRKEQSDRVETVRDTVRREEVEVEQVPASQRDAGAAPKPKD